MSSQKQNINESQIENSQIQLLQATGDAFGFQNSHENRVTINRAFVQLFNQSEPPGVDWDWQGGFIQGNEKHDVVDSPKLSGLVEQCAIPAFLLT